MSNRTIQTSNIYHITHKWIHNIWVYNWRYIAQCRWYLIYLTWYMCTLRPILFINPKQRFYLLNCIINKLGTNFTNFSGCYHHILNFYLGDKYLHPILIIYHITFPIHNITLITNVKIIMCVLLSIWSQQENSITLLQYLFSWLQHRKIWEDPPQWKRYSEIILAKKYRVVFNCC